MYGRGNTRNLTKSLSSILHAHISWHNNFDDMNKISPDKHFAMKSINIYKLRFIQD